MTIADLLIRTWRKLMLGATLIFVYLVDLRLFMLFFLLICVSTIAGGFDRPPLERRFADFDNRYR